MTWDGFVILGDTGDACITLKDEADKASWYTFKSQGVLQPRLARALWPDGLSEYVLPTLASLGLAFPLDEDPAEGLVVLLRLKPGRPERVGQVIDEFCPKHASAFRAIWKIFLGAPPGAIEKVLTRCCSLGGVQTFWRYGVLVRGGFGDEDEGGFFVVVLQYSSTYNELTAQVYGDISSPAPWMVLSYPISAVRFIFLEYPGLRSEGWVQCPQHGDQKIPVANTATRAGEKLLLENAGCSECSPDTAGQGAAAVELLRMVDIRLDRGDLFQEVAERFAELSRRYRFFLATRNPQGEGAWTQEVRNMKDTLVHVRGYVRRIEGGIERVEGGIERIDESVQRVGAGVERVQRGIMEVLTRLRSLQAPNYPYPHLAVIEEAKAGGSPRAEGKWNPLNGLCSIARRNLTLHFLCPADMSKVPCGIRGKGYPFRMTRSWVKKLSPVLQVAVVTARVALKATTTIDVDLSEYVMAVRDGLVDDLCDHYLDEDALSRFISGQDDADIEMLEKARASYEVLRKFMDRNLESLRRQEGYVDFHDVMDQVDDGKRGRLWVRKENVREWESKCAHSPAAKS